MQIARQAGTYTFHLIPWKSTNTKILKCRHCLLELLDESAGLRGARHHSLDITARHIASRYSGKSAANFFFIFLFLVHSSFPLFFNFTVKNSFLLLFFQCLISVYFCWCFLTSFVTSLLVPHSRSFFIQSHSVLLKFFTYRLFILINSICYTVFFQFSNIFRWCNPDWDPARCGCLYEATTTSSNRRPCRVLCSGRARHSVNHFMYRSVPLWTLQFSVDF